MEEVSESDLQDLNNSSDFITSPGGKSRYGRTRRPKVTQDFCDIDHVFMAFESIGNRRASPQVKPKGSPESSSSPESKSVLLSPVKKRPPDVIFDEAGVNLITNALTKASLTKMEDLEMKVANNFKNNIHRGLNSTIKERKFFKSTPEIKTDTVDVSKVLKIITNKGSPSPINPVLALFDNKKLEKRSPLKTYANRRKFTRDDEHWFVESFGLPDEPIVPLKSPVTVPIANKKLDVCDKGTDVNLALPFVDFNQVDSPKTSRVDEIYEINCDKSPRYGETAVEGVKRFKSVKILEIRPSKASKGKEKAGKIANIPKTNARNNSSPVVIINSITPSPKRRTRNSCGLSNRSLPIIVSSPVTPEAQKPKRDRNKKPEWDIPFQVETVDDKAAVLEIISQQGNEVNSEISEPSKTPDIGIKVEDNLDKDSTNNNEPYLKVSENDEKPFNHRRSLRSNKSLTDLDLLKTPPRRKYVYKVKKQGKVLNPASLLANHDQSLPSSSLEESMNESVEVKAEPKVEPKVEEVAIPKSRGGKRRKKSRQPPSSIKFEIFDYSVGDLVWAKLGSFPLWPCLVTTDTQSNTHIKIMSRRHYPYYHVIFFGDNGRRAWVHSLHIHPYNGKYDVEKIAECLTSQNSPQSLVTESCTIKPTYIQKWTDGVEEAESIKEVSPDLRLDCFLDQLEVKKREAYQRKLEKKKSQLPTEPVGIKRVRELSREDSSNSSSLSSKRRKTQQSVVEQKAREESEIAEEFPEVGGKSQKVDSSDANSSDNSSSVPASLESQAAYFKRNNIFKGVPKDKVCQICELPGNVTKCKGRCSGYYHFECAQPKAKSPKNVEIVTLVTKKCKPGIELTPDGLNDMTLAEKIDVRMKEIMNSATAIDSADSSSEEYQVEVVSSPKPKLKSYKIIRHVTADDIDYDCVTETAERRASTSSSDNNFLCNWCTKQIAPPCLVCHKEDSGSLRRMCSVRQCGHYFHPECLKTWPQTKWSVTQSSKNEPLDNFVCPRHVCHTCISDDPRASKSRCYSNKVIKCLRCPATYHSLNYCVPAGSNILSTSQMICTRHYQNQSVSKKRNIVQTVNANWCFICLKGGHLICCETCPTSVHKECLPEEFDEIRDTFYCEDCQSGRLPLYDEIVWVKLGAFRWWPAVILFPNEVPERVRNMPHNMGEFVVKFFGTYDHYWLGRGRTFLFQEGDKGRCAPTKKRVETAFARAIDEATAAHRLKWEFKRNKKHTGMKPPHYVRIKANKPVGNVRVFDGNVSNTTSCECDPFEPHPCGPDSDCLNRLLMTECNPEMCPAGLRCNNQCFENCEYPPLEPFLTEGRGWGLRALAPLRKGQFIIEYVGEMIDEQEYQRRLLRMHQQKEQNYYFLTIDKDRMLDAGPKGNLARFMNHSCQPNCETQKWTVNGDTRVGLFASCDIQASTELTFNYNLECIGKEKKECICGAPNCSGFIGAKAKSLKPKQESVTNPIKRKRKKDSLEAVKVKEEPCFICGKDGNVGPCSNKTCTKFYHLECVELSCWPESGKWMCPCHTCNFCPKRTTRYCVLCTNSYCPPHSNGMVRYDKLLGYLCLEHDSKQTTPEIDGKVVEAGPELKKKKTNLQKVVVLEKPEPVDEVIDVEEEIPKSVITAKKLRKSKEPKSPPKRKLRSRKSSSMPDLPIATRTRFRHSL